MSRYLAFAATAAVLTLLDMATKACVQASFALYETVEVIPGLFNLTYVLNEGAAFSLFADMDAGVRTPLFVVISLIAMAAILWLVRALKPGDRLAAALLGLIFSGALGNLVDRIRFGSVVDFLDVYWKTHHWPAFNVADAAICVGVGGLLLLEIRAYRTQRKQA